MADYILVDKDKVEFVAAFPPAIVSVQAGELKASGPATIEGSKMCVEGDEASVEVKNCSYNSPPFTGGQGTLKVKKLTPGQVARKTKTGKKKVLLKGGVFIAEFEVTMKAKLVTPSGTQEDPMSSYIGQGTFKNTNQKFKGI